MRCPNPDFVSGRELVREAIQFNSATWDSLDTDTPCILTDDIYRDSFSDSNNGLWAYYAGRPTAATWRTGLRIETDIDAALSTDPLGQNWTLNAVAGLWHCVIFTSGTDAPNYYDEAKVHANKVVEDSFTVQQSAIPEFPTAIGAILVVALCGGIYLWLRKRYRWQVDEA